MEAGSMYNWHVMAGFGPIPVAPSLRRPQVPACLHLLLKSMR